MYCHNRADVMRNAAHQGVETQCTQCHDAHSSNNAFLLK
jgi:hypothetical protein